MKYSEFNKKYADLELQYTDSDIYIYCDGVIVGKVSKEYRYRMSTHYDGFEQFPEGYAANLLMNMNMLSETPLAEREEEKRYYLRYDVPPLLRAVHAKPRYLYRRIYDGYIDTSFSQTNDSTFKTIFTESEIAEMDITGFEKVKVTE